MKSTPKSLWAWGLLMLVFSLGLVVWHYTSVPGAGPRLNAAPMAEEALEEAGTRVLPGDRELLPDERVNLNTADEQELMLLPGIGESLARSIVEYREKFGPFTEPEQLMEVSGIGEKTYAALAEFVCVG